MTRRSTRTEIEASKGLVLSRDLFPATLNAIPASVLILNSNNQIVYGNNALLKTLCIQDLAQVTGLRPGELLGCGHSFEGVDGCGTSIFCSACGVFNSIQACRREESQCESECSLNLKKTGVALAFKVTSTPLCIEGERFTVMVLCDIADEKRRFTLERIFFHDIMNLAGGIKGISHLLMESGSGVDKSLSEAVLEASDALIALIEEQRELFLAEKGELQVTPENLDSIQVVKQAIELCRHHELASGKTVLLDPASERVFFEADRSILLRILGNMIKNALEATPLGGMVAVASILAMDAKEVELSVMNPSFIPANVQLKIFQRSFSTKGNGRGLGTYSIKLLTEKYLDGHVGFTSDEKAGTSFFVKLKR